MENELLDDSFDKGGKKPFKVLVCIDGSNESYRGLRYAVRLGSGMDTDLTLLNIRRVDKDLQTDGLDMRMARENMLDWGLELPGMISLKRALDVLKEMGYLDGSWSSETSHIDIQGDPLGDNLVEYTNKNGRKVILKQMVAPSAELGILDESDVGEYDVTIVSSADEDDEKGIRFTSSVSQRIANESQNSVIVAKKLEENHGHLVCLSGSIESLNMARNDAILASRCNCPVYLYSVAPDESQVAKAQAIIDEARTVIKEAGYTVAGEKIGIGDIVENIIKEGFNYSLIVLSGEHKVGFKRFFKSSIIYKVLDGANHSVMICRS